MGFKGPFNRNYLRMQGCQFSFLIILFVFTRLITTSQEIDLSFTETKKSFSIQNNMFLINSDWSSPRIQPNCIEKKWEHVRRITEKIKISDLMGISIKDLFSNNAIQLERELWVSMDKTALAVRQKLINNSKIPINLDSLIVLNVSSENSFKLFENPLPENWNIMVQKRHKNDRPESIIPLGEVKVRADPFFAMPTGIDKNGTTLLIGYLNQTIHLAHLEISFKNFVEKPVLNKVLGIAEFNGIKVPPNGERTSQWIYITFGKSFEKTIKNYIDKVGIYHNVNPPAKDAPTVYCTWYYHGWDYDEELFKKDILSFKNSRIPFDVFLIDETWDVNNWGDMKPNNQFPSGMKEAADKIKELGYIPGLWICPYLVDSTSLLAKTHPEWILKTTKGLPYTFNMNRIDHWVLDLTYPGVLEYLEERFRNIVCNWGYRYFKLDFMRAVFLDGDYVFYNPFVNRLEAYRMGLEAIRQGVGSKSYISVCGGHFGGSIGIANSQRSGSDVFSYWDPKELPKYRQNILRTWMSRLWHVDPDAMMVRRNKKKIHPGLYENLTLGKFNDKEAQINALNQYIGGGLITFTEDFSIIDNDRRELYKHVLPSVNSSSFPLDWYNTELPYYMVTKIDPRCKKLEKWNTVSIVNWGDTKHQSSFILNNLITQGLSGDQFLLFEFFSQEIKGVFKKNDLVELGELDPHVALLIKIIPWDFSKPILAGTDLHFSMGGVEIDDWNVDTYSVKGSLQTDWLVPVNITAVFPTGANNQFELQTVTVQPNQKTFWIEKY